MRLNGRKSIHRLSGPVGAEPTRVAEVRREYAAVLHYVPGSHRVWTTGEELDALDLTVADIVKGANRGAVGEPVGGYPREYQKLLRRIVRP